MAAAQTGDRAAYETLLRDCVSLIIGLARRQDVPADRVDDVVQEVLPTVHRAQVPLLGLAAVAGGFVLRPPRERPTACFCSPFPPAAERVRLDVRGVDHVRGS